MVNLSRLARPFVVAFGLAAALWMALASASASDNGDAGGGVDKTAVAPAAATAAKSGGETPRLASTAPSDMARSPGAEKPRVKRRHVRHHPRRTTPASYYQRRIREAVRRECSGIWCGRPFVLLLGIGF